MNSFDLYNDPCHLHYTLLVRFPNPLVGHPDTLTLKLVVDLLKKPMTQLGPSQMCFWNIEIWQFYAPTMLLQMSRSLTALSCLVWVRWRLEIGASLLSDFINVAWCREVPRCLLLLPLS